MIMEKAFDTAALLEKLKLLGLPVLEDGAEKIAIAVLDWAQESIVLTPNKYDDILIGFIPTLKAELLAQVDKIDGVVG